MKEQTSYELSDVELVDKFMKASAQAGSSNSGHVIDIMAGSYIEHAHYLKGCLLARLDKVQPPTEPGTKVVSGDEGVEGCDLCGHRLPVPKLEPGNYKVSRVWYFRKGWYLELVGKTNNDGGIALYATDQFKVATEEAPAT